MQAMTALYASTCRKGSKLNLNAYRNYTQALIKGLETDSRVLGLIALGSMAEKSRLPDEWSDHDFFVITESGLQESFRQDLSWLPEHERILLNIRETEHGLKVLYDDAHLLEFAIFDSEELHLAKVNDYRVLIDRSNISEILAHLAQSSEPVPLDSQRAFSLFLSLLLVGSGRAARGEILSGHVFINQYALSHLLSLIVAVVPVEQDAPLDNLDPFRRLEVAYPSLASKIHAALLLPPIASAQALLRIAENVILPVWTADKPSAIPLINAYLEQAAQFAKS